MLRRLVRWALWLLVVGALSWAAREGLKRYVEGPDVEPSREPWPAPARSDPVGLAPMGTGPMGTGPIEAGRRKPAAEQEAWIEPNGSGCPASHPVKVKMASKLYHLPGMLAYERTRPDRCYVSAEAAEADGFTRAKR